MDDDELMANMHEHSQQRNLERRQQRQLQHKQPVHRASGPIRPWPWERLPELLRQDTRDTPHVDPDLAQEWSQEVLETLEETDIANTLQAMCQLPYHATLAGRLQSDFTALHAALRIAPSPFHGEKLLVLQEATALWQQTHGAPSTRHLVAVNFETAQATLHQVRIQQTAVLESSSVPERRAQLQDDLWTELTVPDQIRQQLDQIRSRVYQWTFPASVRFTATPVFLYVYSGRRREGDFQQFAEQYIATLQLHAQVMLIDLALNPRHDATDEQLMATLLNWMRHGAVAGLLVAPPCETWTEARNMQDTPGSNPRPLRTADDPFGMMQLTKFELEQVLISSQLLFSAVRLLFGAMVYSAPGIMEHPGEPSRPDRATIWKLPWVLQMQHSGALRKHLIWQARFGSKSAKPTHLAVCHITGFSTLLHSHAVQVDWRSLETLQGRRADGSWMTSMAKEYPPRLNQALAHVLTTAFKCRVQAQEGPAPDPPNFHRDFQELFSGDVKLDEQVMQPDYARLARSGRDNMMVP